MRLNWYKILPESYTAIKGMESYMEKSNLEPQLKELVKIRASQINGCDYCIDLHTKDALAIGESKERIDMVYGWRNSSLYTPKERAALEWCESLTLISETGAPDDVYAEVERLFSPEEIVELTFVIVTINSWNRLSVGFRTEVGNYALTKRF
jgi:AhpD family alkylhydroperoxidase